MKRPSFLKKPHNDGESGSISTIVAVWNFMCGSTLLIMPWAIEMSGLILGPILVFVVGAITWATAMIILQLHKRKSREVDEELFEFGAVASTICPKWMHLEIVLSVASVMTIGGALIVYWMLVSNFTYNTGLAIISVIETGEWADFNVDPICPNSHNFTDATFDIKTEWWTYNLVTVVVCVPLILLSSFGDLKVFERYNFTGSLNAIFLMVLSIGLAAVWGVNVDIRDSQSVHYTPTAKDTFYVLTGALCMGLFMHVAVITVTRNNRHQENNERDLTIGFILAVFTYFFIGTLIYVSFPLDKDCIQDNLFDNFAHDNGVLCIMRGFMLAQLMALFPLVMFVFRIQFLSLHRVTGKYVDDRKVTLLFNTCWSAVFIICSIFIPQITLVLTFVGAGSGMIIIFIGPVVCSLAYLRSKGKFKLWQGILGLITIAIGVLNFVMQFAVFW